MIKRIMAGTAAAGIAVAAFALPAQAGTHKPVNWQQRTCTAFGQYQAEPATGRLDTLVTASLHLPRGYLAADVAQLLADSVTAKPQAKYVSEDKRYVAYDCTNG